MTAVTARLPMPPSVLPPTRFVPAHVLAMPALPLPPAPLVPTPAAPTSAEPRAEPVGRGLSVAEAEALADPARLAELTRLELAACDHNRDVVLAEAAHAAATVAGVPVGLVTALTAERQMLLASHGLRDELRGGLALTRGVPVEWSFCRATVAGHAPVVIEDARRDPRFAGSPPVAGDGIISYVGIPLVTRRQQVIGAVCAVGPVPRRASAAELAHLTALAAEVIAHLERRVGRLDGPMLPRPMPSQPA